MKVIENTSEGKITVCLPEGEQEIRVEGESTESNHILLFKKLIDEYVTKSSDNKIMLDKIEDLGSSEEEAEAIYLYMLMKKVKVEFISSPFANTERFLCLYEQMPEAMVFTLSDLFKTSYKIEDERRIINDPKYTQLSRDEKEE